MIRRGSLAQPQVGGLQQWRHSSGYCFENLYSGNGTFFLATTTSQGKAGDIQLTGKHVTIATGGGGTGLDETLASGSGGTIIITGTANIAVESNSLITTNGSQSGPAGHIEFDTQQLTITGGSIVRSQTSGSGPGGTVTVQGTNSPAQSVMIDGAGSGIFTDTQGTGAGGNIFVNANSVTLQNGGTLSAATSGIAPTATGGTITVNANRSQLNRGQ